MSLHFVRRSGVTIRAAKPGTPPAPQGLPEAVVPDTDVGNGLLQWDYDSSWLAGGGHGGAHENTDHYTRTAGATATLRFRGTRAKVHSAEGAAHGIMAVSLDGGTAVDVDLYGPAAVEDVMVYDTGALADTDHTVVVTCTGRKQASSVDLYAVVDRAMVVSTAPGVPSAVTIGGQTSNSATLTWQPPTSGPAVTGYLVARDGVDATGFGAWSATIGPGERSFTFLQLVAGSTYNLSVTAVTDAGTSEQATAPVTIAASTPVATSRDPLLLPGKSPSGPDANDGNPYVTPIGANAVLVDAGLGPALESVNDIITGDKIFVGLDPADPVRTLTFTDWPNTSHQVHVPSDAAHDGSMNGILVFLAADGLSRNVWQAQPMVLTAGGNPTAKYPWPQTRTVDVYDTDTAGQHGGSHLSALHGTIRTWEWDKAATDDGAITHALSINLNASKYLRGTNQGETVAYRWPATVADGYWNDSTSADRYGHLGSPPAGMKMGALLTLPAAYDFSAITNTRARAVAKALWGFGGYVSDDTAWDVHAISVEHDRFDEWQSVAGEGRAFHDQLMQVFSDLVYVDNNGPTSIGGGGAFRVPPPVAAPPPASGPLVVDDGSGSSSFSYATGNTDPVWFVDNAGSTVTRSGGIITTTDASNFRMWTQKAVGGPGNDIRIKYRLRATQITGDTDAVIEGVKILLKWVAPINPLGDGILDPDNCRGIYPWSHPTTGQNMSPGSITYVPITYTGYHEISKRFWGSNTYVFPTNRKDSPRPLNTWMDLEVTLEWLSNPTALRVTAYKDGVLDFQWTDTGSTAEPGGEVFDWPVFPGLRADDARWELDSFSIEPL